MVQFYHNSWCYSFSHSQAGYRVDIIDHWSIFDHWSIIDLNGRYSWIFGRYCIKMVDISPKYLRMVIDFPYYLKYDKSQDFKVYSAIKWSHMKISTSTLYLLGSRIQSCPNKHAYFCRKTCKYMRQRLQWGQNFWVYSEFLSFLGFNGRNWQKFWVFLNCIIIWEK